MSDNDAAAVSRISSITSASHSTDSSTRSTTTVRPTPSTPASSARRGSNHQPQSHSQSGRHNHHHMRISTDESNSPYHASRRRASRDDGQVSPTSTTAAGRGPLSPSSTTSSVSVPDRRLSDLTNYRRDLAAIDGSQGGGSRNASIGGSAGGGISLASTSSYAAPWMSMGGSVPSRGLPTSFYNDSSDSLSVASQLSPALPSSATFGGASASSASASAAPFHAGAPSAAAAGLAGPARPFAAPQPPLGPGAPHESPDAAYFSPDARRPSVASVTTTASSQGSKASVTRGGFRKLQGFFGEEFPGRDSSESSLPISLGKDQRSRSYSHTRPSHRDRNYSNATDPRDASPSSSRPRTPVPAPEVVPFLYQDNTDIARYGEAPVRDFMTGPDRERYASTESTTSQVPPKSSSSARSGGVHLPGHHYHRHNKSNEDPRTLRPSVSREDTLATSYPRERGPSVPMNIQRSRAHSPTPSAISGPPPGSRSGHADGQTSPGHHGKRGLLGRLRRHKDKDDGSKLRDMPSSTRSLQPKGSRADISRADMSPSPFPGAYWPSASDMSDSQDPRAAAQRAATFNNKFPFSKKGRTQRGIDYTEEAIGPTDRNDPGHVYHLDTNLNDMEGILTKPPQLPPMDVSFVNSLYGDRKESLAEPKGGWDAPDSWAVRRGTEERSNHTTDVDEIGSPPRPEEKLAPYFIRIFRSDGTFSTHSMALDSTVTDVISQVVKKTYVVDGLENYHIIMKKHDLIRVLTPPERPLLMQKRLLQQVGYEEKDRIEELGREDNGYLCRFMFLSARESDFHARTTDLGITRSQKLNYVDLSGRNLVTIPISLYLKASDIISLNLSRNLSLDVPRDFIQSCKHLRDIKFTNNEARKLPLSLGRAGKLTYLDISNNRVEQLEHAELGGLTGLLKMNLANNRLTHLPPSFGAYQALRSLNISSNFLDMFPPFLCELHSLVDLDLSFNAIATLPEEIGNLKNLEKLLITNNRLSAEVPHGFRQLISLRELDIKYNSITSIDIISELPKLELLYAAHNHVSSFVGRFERIRQLKLNSNPLNKFEIIEPVPTLKTLNLSHAQLASIDSAFSNMMNLERLVLDKNYFVSLPQQIGALSRLEHFSIANNSVGELPPQIGCLTELRVLDVRGNNISKLPMEIWWANKLETFNASSNVLEVFPKPASRPPRLPGEDSSGPPPVQNGKALPLATLPSTPSSEELSDERRPSQASSTLLSVGPSPVQNGENRKSSVVSVYGKGGRKTSVVSRAASQGTQGTASSSTPPATVRKDSGLSSRLTNTFAGSLRNLYLADNRLDDDVFDQITLLSELRVLNLSYNDEISDMPQRSIKSWPQLVELYLSGNGLTTVPADDLEESSLLQALYINSNKFTNLPADISRAKKLAVLDCGSNSLKYNISNVPYDWNWNLNPNLRYLNLSGNKRLEIKQTAWGGIDGPGAVNREQYTDFNRLVNLRVLGLMDVTLTQPSIPDQSEDRRVRTSGSLAGHLPYGMADTLGKNEHLSTVDLVVPRFNSAETQMLLGLFDGQALSSGGSKIAKYLHENFGHIFASELKNLKLRSGETPADALRRAFLALNKDLVTIAVQHTEERPKTTHRGSAQPVVLSKEDLNSGGVATVAYLEGTELYVANVGDAQAMVIHTDGKHQMLTRKHDPAEPSERSRIREAGGWVSRNGRLNDLLQVSRAFGYVDLMPAVQAAPHVSNMTIKEHDDIILMATSELWEYLDANLITDIARAERTDLMRAAQKLRDLAMAYGASGKIMVMMISVADLKRRVERSRLHRGTSMSLYPSGVPDEAQVLSTRRGRKAKGDVLDSSLNRLEAEIPAPTGNVAIIFTDIKNSTTLWEMYPSAMRSAIKLHNEVMRRQLRRIGGYEVKTEGDAFMVSFPTATSALLWCFAVQLQLLDVSWPSEILNSMSGQPINDKDGSLIFKGLSVRMGIHFGGDCVSETDPVTRRMDYFGPMVNKASRISAVADGGQITVSSDFISEIQRCLENYQDTERHSSVGSEEAFDEESYASAIRKDLRSLTSQGFEVKEMGEKKLKGLENPEVVYCLYPHALAGRIEYHQQHERREEGTDKPAILAPGAELAFDPETIWALWRVSLRLEMICSTLEEIRGPGLQPPETELLERMKSRGGEVTDRFLLNFMEHQVSRIETCVSTLAMRHIAIGGGVLRELNDLRAPMASVLDFFVNQQKELEQYRKMYGALPQSNGASGPARLNQVVEVEEDHEDINGGDQGENGIETDSDTEHG
ncbi:adenylate cyclase [Purpureocillium lilacinum]|uniref:Adenylate cyclase n=1 Tax=Purpureocillium lilacinum TaxID=33203 RepID=A0A179HP50_PURLI|nr:adenylate cyclase [Purpureocillium lilacinum]OAQ91632.1 adenylate cyclase [Purpureocillium lilacinum]